MQIILNENETMEERISKIIAAFNLVDDVAPIAYWYENLHENGRIKDIHFSQRMRELLGYKSVEEFPDELNTLMTFTHPDDVHIMLDDAIAAATGKLDRYDVQYRIRKASGDYLWCNATGQTVKDHEGKIVGMYGSFIDISKEIELREKQEAERHVDNIIKGVSAEYTVVFLVNMADDSFRQLRMDAGSYGIEERFSNFSVAKEYFLSSVVSKADVEMMRREMDYANIRQKLTGRYSYGVPYRPSVKQFMDWYEMRITRVDDDRVIFAFCEKTGEIISRTVNATLLDKYDALYLVDLNRDEIRPVRPSRVSRVGAFAEIVSYSRLARRFAETVAPNYKEDWLNFSDTVYLKEYMAGEDQREYIYELPGIEHSLRRLTIDVVERVSGEAAVLILAFEGIDDLRAQTILLHRDLAAQNTLNKLFFEPYVSAYYVDLDTLAFQVFRRSEELEKKYPVIPNYVESLGRYIRDEVHPDDQATVSLLIEPERLKEQLAERMHFSFSFRKISEERLKYLECTVIRGAEEGRVAFGFRDITEEINEQKKRKKETEEAKGLIRSVTSAYNVAFMVDMTDDSFRRLRLDEGMLGGEEKFTSFSEAKEYFLANAVYGPDREMMRREMDYGTIREKALRTPVYSVPYRSDVDGSPIWYEMRVTTVGSDKAAFGFRERNREILCGFVNQKLLEEYDALYVVDLVRNAIWPARSSRVSKVGNFHDKQDYREMVRKFAETVVPKYREDWIKFSNPEYVQEYMASEDHREYVYELPEAQNRMRRFSVDVIDRVEGKAATVIFSFVGIDDLRAQAILLHRRLAEQSAFTNFFLDTFVSAYYVNLDTLDCQVYKRTAELERDFPIVSNYLDSVTEYINLDVHPDDREALLSCVQPERMREMLREHPEYTHVFRDISGGKEKYYRMQVIRSNEENCAAFGFMDITEEVFHQQDSQQQLEEALSMAQSANRAKTIFLNSMSHDIRTPMNAIIGYTGLAASHINNKEQVQNYLSKIGQSSNHLLSLINDVLDMSRIESGKMNLDEREENISAIIHTLRDIVQANINARQHDFFIDTVKVNDENIICDKLRLNQVLLNILSNAIKYTAPGGTISMRITEKAVKSSGYATYEFCIKDNGMGMDKDFLKTIFDPFTRVRSSTVSGIQGTGLGMAITKNIVDMMGGKIEVKSEPGKGTEMTVTFDFRLAKPHKVSIEVPELKGLKGLVADDDTETCLSITRMVRDIGMRAEWCTTGKEAVVRAGAAYQEGDSFKVFIIDWLMPDLNGIETTRRIRKVIGDEAPIIILTAYDWSDIEEEAKEAGVTAFVSKPLFPSDLQRVLSSCLGKAAEQEESAEEKYNFAGKKVLLVEDNELNREIAEALLEENGFVVDSAEDGDVAVEKMKAAKAGDYDLVLMDIQMPRMDGYEATRQIRAMGTEISKLPILAMTANAFEEDRKAALEAGMNEHIAKPINVEVLKETLARFL